MAAAETAKLVATYEFQNKGAAATAAAARQVGGLEAATNRGTTGTNRLNTATGKLGGTFNRTGASIGRFVSSNAGLLGLTVGLAGVTKFLMGGVTQAADLGRASTDLGKLLGEPVAETSKLVDVLEKFGVDGTQAITIFGRLNKNAQAFGGTAKKAAKFEQDFGISLVDTNGNIVDSHELLARSADFWNSNATTAEKAATMTKLYGKSWQTLIPLLSQGRSGIDKELKDAIVLTPEDIRNLDKYRVAQRNFNDAFGDLQVKVGIGVMPLLTEGMAEFTNFLDEHEADIVNFVKGAAQGVKEIAGVVISVGKGLADIWGAIPPDFRKLLIGGLVANKALKVTLGIDPIKLVTGALGGLLGRGATAATPMYVKEVGLPGAAGGLGGGKGGLGMLGKGLLALEALGLGFAVFETWQGQNQRITEQSKDIQADQLAWIKKGPSRADLTGGLAAIDEGIARLEADPIGNALMGDQLSVLRSMRGDTLAALGRLDAVITAVASINGQQTINYINSERQQSGTGSIGGARNANVTRGRPTVKMPRVGIEKNRPTYTTIVVKPVVTHRGVDKAKVVSERYGNTPAKAGAT